MALKLKMSGALTLVYCFNHCGIANHPDTQWLKKQSFVLEVHVFGSADLAGVLVGPSRITMGLWIDSASISIHRWSIVVTQFLECSGTDPRTIFVAGHTCHTLQIV